MSKRIVFKANEDITKETIRVGDSFMAYVSGIYDERIYQVSVTKVEGATVELECKWFAFSQGYDLGWPQHFRMKKDDKVWTFSGKLYKGRVTKKGQYSNTIYRLIKHPEFCEKFYKERTFDKNQKSYWNKFIKFLS